MRFRSGVAIDLGTVNTLVSVAGRGLVIDEPSAIALDRSTGRVVAVGEAADALAGKEPQDVEVLHPLRDGVIADLDAASAMLQGFLRRARLRRGLLRTAAVVCVPGGATWVERRSLAAALSVVRPRCTVQMVDEPVAAAAGAGFDLAQGAGVFIVDVGGGTTECAVVAGGQIVRARSLRLGGNAMDEAIASTVKAELGLMLGRNAARTLKTTLGLADDGTAWMETVGVDAARRTPRVEHVPGRLVARALEHIVTGDRGQRAGDALRHPAQPGRGRGTREDPAGRRRRAAARPGRPDRGRHRDPGRGGGRPAALRRARGGGDPGAR